MMPSPHRRFAAGLAAALCVIVPACSSSDDANSSTDTAASPETVAPTTASSTAAATDSSSAETAPVTDPATTMSPIGFDPLGSYTLDDEEFGTMVTVTVDGATRTIVTNALPDHETGEFPNGGNPNTISAQDLTWTYPTEPVFTGSATFAMVPGIALNGVKFEPATAESVTCSSGERYAVEAIEDTYDLGLDFNNAHVQPTGEYHYHGISQLLVDGYASDDDLVLVGFAADGHLMYYSKSGAYEPGYALSTTPRVGTGCVGSSAIGGDAVDIDGSTPDGTYASDWTFSEEAGDLDSCNGTTIDGVYAYLVTDTYPFISRCLNGEATNTAVPGGGAAAPANDGGAPDLTDAAATLGVTVAELQAALGGPPPDLEAAAATLGISIDELTAALPPR